MNTNEFLDNRVAGLVGNESALTYVPINGQWTISGLPTPQPTLLQAILAVTHTNRFDISDIWTLRSQTEAIEGAFLYSGAAVRFHLDKDFGYKGTLHPLPTAFFGTFAQVHEAIAEEAEKLKQRGYERIFRNVHQF